MISLGTVRHVKDGNVLRCEKYCLFLYNVVQQCAKLVSRAKKPVILLGSQATLPPTPVSELRAALEVSFMHIADKCIVCAAQRKVKCYYKRLWCMGLLLVKLLFSFRLPIDLGFSKQQLDANVQIVDFYALYPYFVFFCLPWVQEPFTTRNGSELSWKCYLKTVLNWKVNYETFFPHGFNNFLCL